MRPARCQASFRIRIVFVCFFSAFEAHRLAARIKFFREFRRRGRRLIFNRVLFLVQRRLGRASAIGFSLSLTALRSVGLLAATEQISHEIYGALTFAATVSVITDTLERWLGRSFFCNIVDEVTIAQAKKSNKMFNFRLRLLPSFLEGLIVGANFTVTVHDFPGPRLVALQPSLVTVNADELDSTTSQLPVPHFSSPITPSAWSQRYSETRKPTNESRAIA